MAVLAGLSGAGMKTSLVRQGLLVAGLTIARPAALAIGISPRATQASKGPIMATTLESATNLPTLEAPTLEFGRPSRASSDGTRTTSKPSSTGWVWTKNRIPLSAGTAARASCPVSGRSTPIRSDGRAGHGGAEEPQAVPARRKGGDPNGTPTPHFRRRRALRSD